jgi:hypothetical protein
MGQCHPGEIPLRPAASGHDVPGGANRVQKQCCAAMGDRVTREDSDACASSAPACASAHCVRAHRRSVRVGEGVIPGSSIISTKGVVVPIVVGSSSCFAVHFARPFVLAERHEA